MTPRITIKQVMRTRKGSEIRGWGVVFFLIPNSSPPPPRFFLYV